MRVESDPDDAFSANIGIEYMLSDSFGLDFNLSSNSHDFTLDYPGEVIWTPASDPNASETAAIVGGQSGKIRMTPLTMGVNYHFAASDSVDLSLLSYSRATLR